MKLNIMINNEVDTIISNTAKSMGTSKRNVISLALSSVLEKDISKDYMEEIKETIHLNYKTSVTVNKEFDKKLSSINRYGIAKYKFYGYLICDYFYKQNNRKAAPGYSDEDEHSYSVVYLNAELKQKIMNIAQDKSMTVNSLFIHYLVNKDIDIKLLPPEKNSVKLTIGMTKRVKNILTKKAKEKNISNLFYLQQIARQIEKDV